MCMLTCKRLLDVDHLPRTRLHKPTTPLSRPLQSLLTLNLSRSLQIALIPGHNLHRRDLALINATLLLHINHLHKVVQRIEGMSVCDVIDEEEGVRFEI